MRKIDIGIVTLEPVGCAVFALTVLAAAVLGGAATAQAPAGPPIVSSRPLPPPPKGLSAEETAAYEKAQADYRKCLHENASAIRLAALADDVIGVRDRRQFFESELARNHTLRSSYPGGYDQMLAVTFEQYRSAGGTAATVDAVRPAARPCNNPAETIRGPRVPITDSRTMVVPQK